MRVEWQKSSCLPLLRTEQSRNNARIYKHFTPTGVKISIATLVDHVRLTHHSRSLRWSLYPAQATPDPDRV